MGNYIEMQREKLRNEITNLNDLLVEKATVSTPEQVEIHLRIEKEFSKWHSLIIETINALDETPEDIELRNIYISALFGFARIYHTSLNWEIKNDRNRPEKVGMVKWLDSDIYNQFLKFGVPTHTIEGNWIDWKGEIDQDFIGTENALGNYQTAYELAQKAIYDSLNRPDVNMEACEKAAILSARAVLYRRRGESTGSQSDRAKALELAQTSNEILYNDQRVLDLAKHIFKASVTDWRVLEFSDRKRNFIVGGCIVLENKINELKKSIRDRN